MANWKMHKTNAEADDFLQAFIPLISNITEREIAICPPFTLLNRLAAQTAGNNLQVGAQNMFWAEKGAYTGEISAAMLKEIGCKYVLIGHSERRHVFGETDVEVNRKISAALAAGLIPVCCVGETLEDRQKQLALEVVKQQIEKALAGIDLNNAPLVIAYEPVWAIGTGINAGPDDAQEMIAFIRKQLAQQYDQATAERMAILYGGSVKSKNIADLMNEKDIDGVLVGGASLDAEEFAKIARLGKDV